MGLNSFGNFISEMSRSKVYMDTDNFEECLFILKSRILATVLLRFTMIYETVAYIRGSYSTVRAIGVYLDDS